MQAFKIEDIVSVVREAGKIALEAGEETRIFDKIVHAPDFADNTFFYEKSVVTEADTAVQDFILSRFPVDKSMQIGLVAEEDYEPGNSSLKSFVNMKKIEEMDYTLLLDPIDGTRNYSKWIKKDHSSLFSDIWSVSLCILKGREPLLGVIHFPALGENFTITAEKGSGAFLGDKRISIDKGITFREKDRGRLSTVMGKSRTELQKHLLQDVTNPGSYTGTFLALLRNTAKDPSIFGKSTKKLPPYSFYAGKNIDVLDLSSAPLVYREAGGLICGSTGSDINPFSFLELSAFDKSFRISEYFLILPGVKYFRTLDSYLKKRTGKSLDLLLDRP